MKVTIFGTGYVGLVTGICLADMGNHVRCADAEGGTRPGRSPQGREHG